MCTQNLPYMESTVHYYIAWDTLQKQNGCFNPARVISVAASESILNYMLDQYTCIASVHLIVSNWLRMVIILCYLSCKFTTKQCAYKQINYIA